MRLPSSFYFLSHETLGLWHQTCTTVFIIPFRRCFRAFRQHVKINPETRLHETLPSPSTTQPLAACANKERVTRHKFDGRGMERRLCSGKGRYPKYYLRLTIFGLRLTFADHPHGKNKTISRVRLAKVENWLYLGNFNFLTPSSRCELLLSKAVQQYNSSTIYK